MEISCCVYFSGISILVTLCPVPTQGLRRGLLKWRVLKLQILYLLTCSQGDKKGYGPERRKSPPPPALTPLLLLPFYILGSLAYYKVVPSPPPPSLPQAPPSHSQRLGWLRRFQTVELNTLADRRARHKRRQESNKRQTRQPQVSAV